MPTMAMVFDMFARDRASATFTRVGVSAERAGVQAEAASKRMHGFAKALGVLALVEVGKKSLQMAGDFQQSTNVLVTAAGETQKNLAGVRKGIMDIAVGTGTPLKELTDGMYQVEKAGYRGADGLNILKTASQGAREEGASLAVVTSAMTSIMQSYHVPVKNNVAVMNQLKTAAGESKTTMEQFAGSLSTVLPVASANHISFAKVAGALATLTQHGTSADEATQELSNTIRNLSAPNMVAIKEMGQLGINSQDVSQKLGQRGVAGTLNYLSETILRKMGPSGKVLLKTFLQSSSAAADVTQMMQAMEPATRALAQGFIDGSLHQNDWVKSLSKLTPQQASLARQFAVAENKARGFNVALRQGMPGSQTYTDAIKKMTGGANGLNTTLQLTGESTAGTTERIKKIADAAKNAGKDVDGWASTQKLFNVQLDMARQQVAVLGVKIGTALIPHVLDAIHGFSNLLGWVQKNSKWLAPLAKIVGTVAGAIFLVNKATLAWKASIGALTAVKGVFGSVTGGINNFVTKADSAGGAVKTWGSRLGGLAGFLGGPWGIAIGLGVTALALFLGKQKQALHDTPQFKQDVLDYASAMDQMKGAVARATAALDANVRAQTVNGLQQKGAFDLAEKLGIGVKTLTDATMGNHAAQKLVNSALSSNLALNPQLSKSNSDRRNWATQLSNLINAQSQAELEQIRQENQRRDAMNAGTKATKAQELATHSNRSALLQAILTVNEKAKRDFESTLKTKGMSAALRVASADLRQGKTDIMNAAAAAHANTGKVADMVKQYLLTPGAIKKVRAQVQGLNGDMSQFHSKAAHLDIQFRMAATKAAASVFAHMPGSQASGLVGLRPGFASGGILPGFTPGRDVHRFYSPTAGNIDLSGGEGIMRPELTAAIGPSRFNAANQAAKAGRVQDGLRFLGSFADGGILARFMAPRRPLLSSVPGAAESYALNATKGSVQGVLSKLLASVNAQMFNGPMVSKFLSAVGESYAVGMCLQFVRTLLGAPGGPPTALAGWNAARYKHPGDKNPPPGAPVWWGGGQGHVADYVGGGKIVSTDLPTMGRVGLVPFMTPSTRWGKKYLGWTGDIDGKVLQFGPSLGGAAAGSGSLRNMAQQLLQLRGWNNQFPSLDYIISHESGWNVHARNASSGAYGLGQALPASKMKPFGADYMNSGNTQLRWMLDYIGGRYGDPNGAAAFWRGHHWYDGGGYLQPGMTFAHNNTGQRERVLDAGETRRYEQGGRGPLINIERVESTVDLEAFVRAAEFRARQGSFG